MFNILKVKECLFVCLSSPKDLAIGRPVIVLLTEYLLIGPGKVFKYFGGGYQHSPTRKQKRKKKEKKGYKERNVLLKNYNFSLILELTYGQTKLWTHSSFRESALLLNIYASLIKCS